MKPVKVLLLIPNGCVETRKALSQSLASFIPSIAQTSSPIASRLELFRSEILAGFDPADKKKEATDEEELGELLDGSIGLEDIALQPLETARSRAGLYIYLNAAVSPTNVRPLENSRVADVLTAGGPSIA